MDDLRRRLEELAQRGQPRGAAAVLADARRGRVRMLGPQVRLVTVVAIAACVMLIAGVAAAVWSPTDEPTQQVAGPTTTEPAPTTTTEPATTTSLAPAPTKPPVTVPARVVAASRLQPFRSWNAYLAHMKGKGVEVVGPYGLPYPGGPSIAAQRRAQEATGQGVMAVGGSATEDRFSTTNNQEDGIDEPDVAKTDGRTIFSVSGDGILRASSGRGTPTVLGTLSVPQTSQMLLVGDKVVLFGGGYEQEHDRTYATLAVVDAARPDQLRLSSRMEIDGSVLSARLIGGAPRIVVQSAGPELRFVTPAQPTDEDLARAESENRSTIESSVVDSWVPNWKMTEGPRRGRAGRLVSFDRIYRPPSFAGFGLLTLMTVNVADPSASDTSAVVADGHTVYASATRLYVASQGWGPVTDDQGVARVNETLVHAFDVSAVDRSSYKVSGKVSGAIKDQFSLSEHQGVLRVVTTSRLDQSETFVRTLADQGQILEEMGQVGGLGRGEQVYAVRFLGAMGYVVTFRQVDPLYVVDLSDPRRPRVRGELKIPGYSAYLHPIGDGLLLGIGAEATDEGRRTGLGASVFDVSNPDAPARVQHFVIPSAHSTTEFDHHAFLWWPATGLAVLPVTEYPSDRPGIYSAIGLRAGKSVLTEVGRVQHPSNESDPYVPVIQRSIVIGDRLYTISPKGIMQSDLQTLAQEAWVAF